MALIKWGPFSELFYFSKQSRCNSYIAVYMYEDDNNLIVDVNIPGINPEEITV